MPEFTRPLPYIPPDLSMDEVRDRFPTIVRELGNWVAEQITASEKRIIALPSMTNARVAYALIAAENQVALDFNRRAAVGAVLTIIATQEGYQAAFILGDGSAPDGTVPTITLHNLLSATHPDTLAGTVVRGDLIVGNSTPKWARFAKGASGTILQMGANDPAWTAVATAIAHNLLDGSVHPDTVAQGATKGSMIVGNSTPKWDELVVGTDTFVLTADSTQTLGVKWAAVAAGNEFADNVFRVYDNGDNTKKVALEVSGVSTATTRTWTVRNESGTVPLLEGTTQVWTQENQWTLSQIWDGIAHEQDTPLPARPSSGLVKMFAEDGVNRVNPAMFRAAGRMQWLQGLLGNSGCVLISPGTGTAPSVVGIALGTAVGTVSHPTPSNTSAITALRRAQSISAVGANSQATMFESQTHLWIGNGTNLGGFTTVSRGALAGSALSLGHYGFMGLRNSATAIGNTQPTNLVDCCGVGADAGDTNYHIFHNDNVSTSTKTDTGIAVGLPIQLEMHIDPNGTTMYFRVTRIDDPTVGEFTYSANTNLPRNSVFLAWHIQTNTGADTTTACTTTLYRHYGECDV